MRSGWTSGRHCLLAHLMMWMMNVLGAFVAEILVLHRVQAVNRVQKLRCWHQRRQLLE